MKTYWNGGRSSICHFTIVERLRGKHLTDFSKQRNEFAKHYTSETKIIKGRLSQMSNRILSDKVYLERIYARVILDYG